MPGSKPGPSSQARAKKAAETRAEMRKQAAIEAAPRPESSEHDVVWVKVSDIFIDPAYFTLVGIEGYQREQNPSRVRSMAEAFNPDHFGVLTLSDRESGEGDFGPNGERYACVDGGHRLGIFQYLGWLDDLVPCDVYHGLTVAEEARMFVAMNKDRIKVLPMQIFMGKVTGRVPEAVALYEAITSAGVKLSKNMGAEKGVFRAIVEAERVQRVAGNDVVHMAMLVMNKAFGEDPAGLSGRLFAAIAYLLHHFGRIINMGRLVEKLSHMEQEELLMQGSLLRKVGGKSAIVVHIATAIQMEYNKNLRSTRLPDVPRGGWKKGTYTPDKVAYTNITKQLSPHWETENGIPTDEEAELVIPEPVDK